MKVLKPSRLMPGATIGIVSLSGPVRNRQRFERGAEVLRGMGYRVRVGRWALGRHGPMAGTDEERAADLHEMFADPQVDGIFSSTGGSCSLRLLPRIDYSLIRRNPKIFLGMSDVSILLNAITARAGLLTFHGPFLLYGLADIGGDNPSYSASGRYTRDHLRRVLSSPEPMGRVEPLTSWEVLREGRASGRLVGGNITGEKYLLGTAYCPNWKGSLFFWEAIHQEPHILDQELAYHRAAGVFDQISGMIVGHLEQCEEVRYRDGCPDIREIILSNCQGYDFPILFGVDFGHNCETLTLPIGARATIDTGRSGGTSDSSLIIEESAVL